MAKIYSDSFTPLHLPTADGLRIMVNPEWEYNCRVCGMKSVTYIKNTKINICSDGCLEVYNINPLAYEKPVT
jgi:hypothetical protein